MIKGLRENEEVILYVNRPVVSENEKIKVVNFLRGEYERLNYHNFNSIIFHLC